MLRTKRPEYWTHTASKKWEIGQGLVYRSFTRTLNGNDMP